MPRVLSDVPPLEVTTLDELGPLDRLASDSLWRSESALELPEASDVEIAKELGIRRAHARQLVFRAMTNLREQMFGTLGARRFWKGTR